MRIAVVHSFYASRQPSGENVVVQDQVAQLLQAGHEVRLVGQSTDDLVLSRSYPVRAAWTTVTGAGPDPSEVLRHFRPDIVHVHNTFPNWSTNWSRRYADRLVCTLHNYRPICAAATLLLDGVPCRQCLSRPVIPAVRNRCYRGSTIATLPLALASAPGGSLRRLVKNAAAVIALNSDAQRTFAQVFARTVCLVPNFVPRTVSEAQTPLVVKDWAYIGRLDEAKGVRQLLSDWPREHRLHVFGDGPLRTEVDKASRARTEIHYAGTLERRELLKRLGTFTGIVMPSLWSEGLPTVMLESLSAGTPLVISSHVSTGQEAQQAGAAVVYRPSDAADLRRALDEVVRRRSGMAADARALHERLYSPEKWQVAIDEIYARVAHEDGSES